MADPAPDFIPLPSSKPKEEAPDFIPLKPTKERGPLANAVMDSDLASALKGAGTAGIKGLSTIIGMPGDLSSLTDYLAARSRSPLSAPTAAANQERTKDVRADVYRRLQEESPTLAKALGYIPAPPTSETVAKPVLDVTGEYVPQTEMGRNAMLGVEGAAAMLGPGGLSGGLRAAGRGVEGTADLARAVLRGSGTGAAMGAIANPIGVRVAEFTGDPLVGIAAGAAVPAGVATGVKTGFRYAAPVIPSQRQNIADQKLFQSTKDPQAVIAAAEKADIVPGSKPTLAEISGDPKLLQAQKAAQTVDQTDFNIQQGQQNGARLAELQRMAPGDADMMAPGKMFRDRIESIERSAQETVDLAKKRADEANAAIPGGVPMDVSGAQLRDIIAATADKAQAARSRLYRAVDPDGALSVVTTGARDEAGRIAQNIDPSVSIPSPISTPIIEMVANLPEVTPFSKLVQMDSTISGQMAKAKLAVDNVGYGQLKQLKGAVMDAINNAVENQAKWEQGAVARGELAAENTVGSRLLQDSSEWLAQEPRSAISARAGNDASVNAPGMAGPYRGQSEAGRGPGVPEGAQGVPGDVPNFDAEAAQRLAAAKQAHAEYAQTYREGPVAPVLKDTGYKEQYKLPNAAVPAAAFLSGDKGYGSTQAFLKAANNAPEAVSALQDIAVARLRQEMKGGPLTPQALNAWQTKYANSLRAIDEATPGFSQKFGDAATATDALGLAQRALDNALAAEQKGVAGRFLGVTDPGETVNIVGQMLTANDGPTQIKDLLSKAGRDTNALQGLRKAGVEYMMQRLTNAGVSSEGQPILSSAGLRDFVSKREGALKALYGDEHVANMRRIAGDMERTQKAFDAMRVKGGSDSMPNFVQWLKDQGGQKTELMTTLGLTGATAFQMLSMDPMGTLLGVGSTGAKMAWDRIRAAGIENARDLYVQGLVDPEIGAAMLKRAIDKNGNVNVSVMRELADTVGRSAARSAYLLAPEEKRERRASGGAVMDHASIANKLIQRAEMAGRNQTTTTEPLLAVPDDTVARALEIAGQGI